MAYERGTVSLFSLGVLLIQIFASDSQSVVRSKGVKLGHQNGTSRGVYLITSSDVTVRVGEQLQLNCTVVGADNSSKYQLSWYHGKQKLGENVIAKLRNNTVQVNIDAVDRNNNGTYVCKETANSGLLPRSVVVRVGDIPSSPQNVWINNVEFEPRIHWTAPKHPGGLPLSYVVKEPLLCKNVTRSDNYHCSLCYNHLIFGTDVNTFMCTLDAISLLEGNVYEAIVEVKNALGFNTSSPVEFKANKYEIFLTTPQPAKAFTATEVQPATTVKLSWEDPRQLNFFVVQYTILYHEDGDKQNKSLILHSPKVSVLIHGLFGFTHYYFYLLVQYGNTTTFGTYSKVAVQTVMTSVLAPSRPATIINCSQWRNASSDSHMIVTWEFPPSKNWNGPLKYTKISYRCQRGSRKIDRSVSLTNSTVRSVALPGIQATDKCSVWMRICNGPQLCSAISNICVKPGKIEDKKLLSSRDSKPSVLKIVLISLAGTTSGVALVFIVARCVCRRGEEREVQPLANLLGEMSSPVHGYDEIEEPLVNNHYEMLV
ncbi:hypothetical protein ABFA07_022620 [Porites harrisoni]